MVYDGLVIFDRDWCMGIDPSDVAAKENWNKSSHGHKLAKILMNLLFMNYSVTTE